jgi:hypothetical protein
MKLQSGMGFRVSLITRKTCVTTRRAAERGQAVEQWSGAQCAKPWSNR